MGRQIYFTLPPGVASDLSAAKSNAQEALRKANSAEEKLGTLGIDNVLPSSGTVRIGTFHFNGKSVDVYAPAGGRDGSTVEWEGSQGSGVPIGTLTIDGHPYVLYAPEGGSGGGGSSYVLPVATDAALGGVRTGYASNGLNRAVQLDSSGRMYVVLPGKPYCAGIYQINSSTGLDSLTKEGMYSFFSSSQPGGLPEGYGLSHGAVEVFGVEAGLVQRLTRASDGRTWVRSLSHGTPLCGWTELGAAEGGGGGGSSYVLPVATDEALGGIETGYSETASNRAVRMSGRKAYVTLPVATGESPGVVRVVLSGTEGNALTGATFVGGVLTLERGTVGPTGGGGMTQEEADGRYLRRDTDEETSGTLTATAFYEPSDRRLKEGFEEEDTGGSLGVRYVSFRWKRDGSPSYGVVAQEAEQLAPGAVRKDGKGLLSVNYTLLHSMQLSALIKKVNELEARLESLAQG